MAFSIWIPKFPPEGQFILFWGQTQGLDIPGVCTRPGGALNLSVECRPCLVNLTECTDTEERGNCTSLSQVLQILYSMQQS